jgi:hypothetical protein
MPKARIPPHLRRKVEQAAKHRCGYCLTPQAITGMRMQIDHIIPEAMGGATVEENLWLACVSCNRFKSDRTHADDPVTGQRVRLFDPRRQGWKRHFTWSEDGIEIIGLTPSGRATIDALRMNNADIVGARSLWVQAGWWPPDDQEV